MEIHSGNDRKIDTYTWNIGLKLDIPIFHHSNFSVYDWSRDKKTPYRMSQLLTYGYDIERVFSYLDNPDTKRLSKTVLHKHAPIIHNSDLIIAVCGLRMLGLSEEEVPTIKKVVGSSAIGCTLAYLMNKPLILIDPKGCLTYELEGDSLIKKEFSDLKLKGTKVGIIGTSAILRGEELKVYELLEKMIAKLMLVQSGVNHEKPV